MKHKVKLAQETAKLMIEKLSPKELENELYQLLIILSDDDLDYIYKDVKKEVSEDNDEKLYIYERNSDTGEIFRRKKGDYTNRECINPAVNTIPNL